MVLERLSLTQDSADERYQEISNVPLLKDKFPEQIREKALSYKAAMLKREGPVSWVLSIQ